MSTGHVAGIAAVPAAEAREVVLPVAQEAMSVVASSVPAVGQETEDTVAFGEALVPAMEVAGGAISNNVGDPENTCTW